MTKKAATPPRPRKNSCRVLLPVGDCPAEVLRPFIADCLVPALASRFFEVRRLSRTGPTAVNLASPTLTPLIEEHCLPGR